MVPIFLCMEAWVRFRKLCFLKTEYLNQLAVRWDLCQVWESFLNSNSFFFLITDRPPPQRQQVCTINGAQTMYCLRKKSSSPQSLSYIPFPPDFLASLTGYIAGSLPILHKLSVWQQLGHISVQLWQSQVTVVNELLRDLRIWNTSTFVHLETQRHVGQQGEREKSQRSAWVTLPCHKREFLKKWHNKYWKSSTA